MDKFIKGKIFDNLPFTFTELQSLPLKIRNYVLDSVEKIQEKRMKALNNK
jgi:hypothetical protein